jgi:hypothetical protein
LIPAGNLTTNPSFEADLSGWESFQGTLDRVAHPEAPDGRWVVQVTCTTGNAFTVGSESQYVPVTNAVPGTLYTGSAYVAAASSSSVGKSARVFVRETSAGAATEVASSPVSLTYQFQRIETSWTVLDAGATVEVYVGEDAASVGDEFYADVVSLVLGADAGPSSGPAELTDAGSDGGAGALPPSQGCGCSSTESAFYAFGLLALLIGSQRVRRAAR